MIVVIIIIIKPNAHPGLVVARELTGESRWLDVSRRRLDLGAALIDMLLFMNF